MRMIVHLGQELILGVVSEDKARPGQQRSEKMRRGGTDTGAKWLISCGRNVSMILGHVGSSS